eukprot:g20906.t1
MRRCNEEATGRRQRCGDLQEAIEHLGEARAKAAEEVGGLSKRQLSEIRRLLRSPPEPVKRTLAACWLLLHCQRFKDKPSAVRFDEKTDWPRCQRMLVDEGFIASVLSFDSKQLDEVPSVPACVAQSLGIADAGHDAIVFLSAFFAAPSCASPVARIVEGMARRTKLFLEVLLDLVSYMRGHRY